MLAFPKSATARLTVATSEDGASTLAELTLPAANGALAATDFPRMTRESPRAHRR